MVEVEKSGALNSHSRMVPRNWNTTQSYTVSTVYTLLEKELLSSWFFLLWCMCFNISLPYSAYTCLYSVSLGVKPMRSLLAAAVAWEKIQYAKFFRASAKDKLMSEIEALRSSSRLQPHAQVAEAGLSGGKNNYINYIIEFHIISCKISTWRSWRRSCFLSKSIRENQLSPALSHWTELLVCRLL